MCRKLMYVIVLLQVFFLRYSTADAATVFRDTFETHPLGTLPSTPEVGYLWNMYTGVLTKTVEDSNVLNGSKALEVTATGTPGMLQGYCSLVDSAPEPGYDMIFKTSWSAQTTGGMAVHLMLGSGQRVTAWYASGTTYYAFNGSIGGWVDTGVASALNRWDTIEMVMHLVDAGGGQVTGTLDMWLTAGSSPRTLIAKGIPMATWTWASNDLPRIWIAPQSSANTSYWDDVSIEKETLYSYEYGIICPWSDNVVLFGAETDPAVDTQEAIHNMMVRWKNEGWDTNIFWYMEGWWLKEPHFSDLMYMNPNSPPVQLQVFVRSSNIVESFDVLSYARQEAENLGMTFWVNRMLYNDGTLVGNSWPYQFKFMYDHPEYEVADRSGNPQLGIREMAYPQARQDMVDQFVHMVNDCGLKHIMVSLKTEMALGVPAPATADTFGFNQPVVEDMLAIYDVNILTDTRFDVNVPNWDPCDSMVENWRELRGGYLTQFLRELRDAMDNIDPNIEIAVLSGRGDYIGPPYGNMKLQWRTWVDEGIIDALLVVNYPLCSCGYGDCVSGYFYVPGGTGTLPYATMHDYIHDSNHPEIKFFRAGADYGTDTDGAVTDSIGQDTTYARNQRVAQVEQILAEDGYITFMEQNFDSFPIYNPGWANGGLGDYFYYPSLNSSPGFWEKFGDGNDLTYPVIQNDVYHGASGNAMRLNGGGNYISGIRGVNQYTVDHALDSGYATVDFWIYRKDTLSSCSVFLDNGGSYVFDVGVLVTSGSSGTVYIRTNNTWVSTGKTLSTGQWHRIFMVLDINEKEYSIYTGENADTEIYTGATWDYTGSFSAVLMFSNGGTSTNITYFDDVRITWNPNAVWYTFEFSEEDLWAHTTSADSRLYNQLAPRRHHTAWKTNVQTTDSTQPNQNVYQTTNGTDGWYQSATFDSWLSGGPLDNYNNYFGICQFNLWGAGRANGRLAWNERFRVNGGPNAWKILSTPDGWTGSIVDNPWDDNNTGGLDQYYIEWAADDYNDRILYDSYGDEVDDYVFRFAVNIVGEYDTTLEPDPNDNPFESDGTLRVWFGGNVLDPNDEFTDEGFDGIMTLTPEE